MTAIGSFETDYRALTEACGLLDRSERGKLALTGAEAKTFLQGQVTNDVEALSPGRGCYAAFLNQKGKMLGDLRILEAEEELLLDTERVALQELFNMIRRFSIGYAVELHKRTLESGLLSLIGPDSEAVCTAAAGIAPGPGEHDHVAAELGRLIRTDVGIDVLCEAGQVAEVRHALHGAGAAEVGEPAAECLRVERGRPRYGIDLDDSVIPQEAALNERAVSFTKGCYVGQETVARLFYKGKPNRHLRGLAGEGELTPGAELLYGDRVAGRITSAATSPRFGPIGLALVRREVPLEDLVEVNGEGTSSARVVELPFR